MLDDRRDFKGSVTRFVSVFSSIQGCGRSTIFLAHPGFCAEPPPGWDLTGRLKMLCCSRCDPKLHVTTVLESPINDRLPSSKRQKSPMPDDKLSRDGEALQSSRSPRSWVWIALSVTPTLSKPHPQSSWFGPLLVGKGAVSIYFRDSTLSFFRYGGTTERTDVPVPDDPDLR